MKHNEQLAATLNTIMTHQNVIVTLKNGDQIWGQFLAAYPECVIVLPIAQKNAVALAIDDVADVENDKIY